MIYDFKVTPHKLRAQSRSSRGVSRRFETNCGIPGRIFCNRVEALRTWFRVYSEFYLSTFINLL